MKHQYPINPDIGLIVRNTFPISFQAFDQPWTFHVRSQSEANIAKSCLSYYKPFWEGIVAPPVNKLDRVVDIGGHIGFFSIPISSRVGWVGTFEPCPANFELLGKNIAQNGVSNINIFPFAVGANIGPVQLNLGVQGTTGHSITNRKKGGVHVEVLCTTLEEIVNFYSPTILKIDCEGAEWDILTNAALLTNIRMLIAELHKVKQHDVTKITSILEQAGMRWVVKHNSWFSKLVCWRQ